MPNPFQNLVPKIDANPLVRTPQREAFAALAAHAASDGSEREIGVVLPVGCGKSGCIAITPFAFRSERTLVIAPGVNIADQLHKTFDPTHQDMFYSKCEVLDGSMYPEPVLIRGTTVNRGDLDDSHIAITNIQQLQGDENRWLRSLPENYFDLILFDEGHHSVAETYEVVKGQFPNAMVVNFSATPLRADGRTMAGRVIYSYPIFRAIQEGFVKGLKAVVLNPSTLRYVRQEDDSEVEVSLEEVKRLGEVDADFRRSIVTSEETLITIVDASIRELERIRNETGVNRHKIIACALNYQHCIQIVQAYEARGKRAAYVHSREDSITNKRILQRLDNHELDVIVQVSKLGEGFDHPYLSVAAVFKTFANLSPFVQFVGRIMRVVRQNAPGDPNNKGTVVFHAGANVASRWEDFQQFTEADQDFFDQLLPTEELDFSDASEIAVTPTPRTTNGIEIRSQDGVHIEIIPLLENPEAMSAIQQLQSLGYTPDDVLRAMQAHRPVPTTRVSERQAARHALDNRVQNEVGRILRERNLNPQGRELDRQRLGRTNFVVLKAAIDKEINRAVGRPSGERHEFNRQDLETISARFSELVANATDEVFNG